MPFNVNTHSRCDHPADRPYLESDEMLVAFAMKLYAAHPQGYSGRRTKNLIVVPRLNLTRQAPPQSSVLA
jgi:hypothetical protein